MMLAPMKNSSHDYLMCWKFVEFNLRKWRDKCHQQRKARRQAGHGTAAYVQGRGA
jgi:hypothetical protein